MAYTDYKWWCVNRDDDGYITWACVRFYEGGYELREDADKQMVNTYVRSKRLAFSDLKHIRKVNERTVFDAGGNPTVKFTDKDFGRIRTDDELRAFCNTIIAKDTKRTAIDEQKVVSK